MNANIGKVFPKTPRVILANDIKKFDKFIDSKRSPSTKTNVSQNCYDAFKFFNENYPDYKSVLDITPDDFEEYFKYIEGRTLRKDVKRKYRNNLKAFINFLLGKSRAYNEQIRYNYEYIFSDDFKSFTDTSGAIERDALSIRDVFETLAFYKTRGLRDYVLVGLLAYSGCRVGGLCSLKVEDIDFEKRTFQTQEKVVGGSTGWNRYFFPQKFKLHLESYLLEYDLLSPSEDEEDKDTRLFPIETKSVRELLYKYPKRHVNPHLFRDAINTHWVEIGLLDAGIRAILLNQKPNGINAGHYLKTYTQNDKSGKNRLELYDKYFPY